MMSSGSLKSAGHGGGKFTDIKMPLETVMNNLSVGGGVSAVDAVLTASWNSVNANLDLNGERFMMKLLVDSPHVLTHFKFAIGGDKKLYTEEGSFKKAVRLALKNHGRLFLEIIGEVMVGGGLEACSKVWRPRLVALARHHFNLHLVPIDYLEEFKAALLFVVEGAVGPSVWSADVARAWASSLNEVSKELSAPGVNHKLMWKETLDEITGDLAKSGGVLKL